MNEFDRASHIPAPDSFATDRETAPLISSEKVAGSTVYDHEGNKLGHVHSLMIGKANGQVAYAVICFGGWLGIGSQYFPLPWRALTYSTRHDGYVVWVDDTYLRTAPQFVSLDDEGWNDADWRQAIDRYYAARRPVE